MTRLLLFGLLLLGIPAHAHTLSVSHVDIDARTRDIVVDIDIPLRDLAIALPLDLDGDDAITWREVAAAQAELEARVKRGFAVRISGLQCPLRPRRLATRMRAGVAHASLRMTGTCEASGDFAVDYRVLGDELPAHTALVTLQGPDGARSTVTRNGARTASFPAGTSGRAQNFLTFLREGVHHILVGYDHVAFLLSLLLPAALWREGGQWRAVTSARRALRHTVALVTAFTIAHSVTLSLAMLGLVRAAAGPVEVIIAASVALAALNNIWPVVTRHAWVLAFGFGLVHGFGFAGALGEIGLPPGGQAMALIGFNLGVEAGQLAIVALALPPVYAARRNRAYATRILPAVSLGIAALGLYWMSERLAYG